MGAFDDLVPAASKPAGAFDDLVPTPNAPASPRAFDDLIPPPDDTTTFEKIKGAPIKFAVGAAEGLQRTAANIGQGIAQASDPGPLKNNFGNFLRAQDAALKETQGPQFDPVANTVKTHDTLARAMGNMILQREAQREKLRAPGEAFSDAANEVADQAAFVNDITPGPKVVATAGNKTGEILGTMTPAAIPIVGPITGAASAGAGSTGATFSQAYEVYKQAGYNEDDAREKARNVALSTGGMSTLIFSLPIGQLAGLPKATLGRLLTAAGIGGAQMGTDTFQSLLQAKATYNPSLTIGQIVKRSGESAAFGALLGGALHGAGELTQKPQNGEQLPGNGEQVPPGGEQPPAPGNGKTGTIAPVSPPGSPADTTTPPGSQPRNPVHAATQEITAPTATPGHPAMPAINKLAEAVEELRATLVPPAKASASEKPAVSPDSKQNDSNSKESTGTIVPETSEQGKPTPEEWDQLLKPNAQRDLRAEGVTQENVDALLSGKKTPEQVVDEQLGITKSGGSIDARTMIVEENADGSRSIGFGPEAGPASTTPINVGQMSHGDAIELAREQGVERIRAILADRPSLTERPEGEKTPLAAPETETGGTAPEVADTPVTPAEKAAPLVPSETIPVEGGESPSRSAAGSFSPFKVGDKLEHDGKVKTVTRISHNPNYVVLDGRMVSASETRPVTEPAKAPAPRAKLSYTNNRPHDIIDEIESQHGTIDPTLIKEANRNWKPVGAARKIFKKGGTPADVAATELSRSGHYKGDAGQVDQLGDAVNAAAQARKGFRATAARENKQANQDAAFARDVSRPGVDQRTIIADDLQPGDTLKIRGAPFKVREFEFDDDGNVKPVAMDDGAKYGTQTVAGGTEIKYDNRSLTRSTEPVVNRRTPEGTTKQRLAGEDQPGEARSRDKTIDFLQSLKSDTKGKLHAFGLAPEMWNRLVDAVILAVRGGRKIAEAVSFAFDKFKKENPDVPFDEDGAREHFEKTPRGNLRYESPEGKAVAPVDQLKAHRTKIDERLAEIAAEANKAQKKFTNLPDDLRSERFQLAKERRQISGQLLEDPAYVRELILAEESKGAEYHAAKAAGDTARAEEIAEESLRTATEPESELERVAPELYDQGRKQLESEGVVKPIPQGTPPGRSLGDLSTWLKENKIDSPKLSVAERFSLARRLGDSWQKVADLAHRGFNRIMSAWGALKAQYSRKLPTDNNVRSLRKDWLYEKQVTGMETQRWLDAIDKTVQRPDRQMALSIYLDAGRDENVLRSQLDYVPEKWKKVWRAALSLTPSEKDLAARLALEFNTKLADGQRAGIIDRGREDYGVPQLWKKDKAPKYQAPYDPADPQFKKQGSARSLRSQLDTRDPFFALKRVVPSYFDGIMAGGEPMSLKIRDLVGIYNAQFHDALSDRAFVWALKNAKMEDGAPVVQLSGGVKTEPAPEGGRRYFVDSSWRNKDAMTKDGRPYVSLDHTALKGWKFSSQDGEGNPILVHGDFLVHPDAVNEIHNDLSRSALRDPKIVGELGAKVFNGLLQSTVFMKASKFAAATFHGFTLAEHLMTHAFAGKPTAERLELLNPSVRGVEMDPLKNPKVATLMRNGMMMGFDGQRHLFEEGLASSGGILEHVHYLGDVLKGATRFVFENYLPKLKAKLGSALLDANRERYSKQLSDDQIAEITANQVNAAFGGQNWRLAGTNKMMLDVNRILFTAPDFLLSRLKVIAQATKPYNREQAFFLVAQAALVYTGARVLNSLFSKDHNPHWEPSMWDKVIIGKRAYSARFLVSDLSNAVQDPVNFAAGRVGPWPKTVIDGFVQRDWRTGARIDVPFKTDNRALRAVQIMAKDAASWMLPVGSEGFLPGAPVKDETKGSQIAQSLLGVGSRKYTAETQMYNAAANFNRGSSDAKTKQFQQERDDTAQAESKYRKLTDLLDANRLDDAKKEYQDLINQGSTPAQIATHFQGIYRAFTGNLTRERAFKASLSPADLQTYNEAIQERKERRDKFNKIH